MSLQAISTHKPISSFSQHRAALSGSTTLPDAELLALGRQFAALHAAYLPLRDAEQVAEPAYLARVRELESLHRPLCGEERLKLCIQAEAETGLAEAGDALDALVADMEPVANAIENAPAHSLAGLVIKARAAIWAWERVAGKTLAQGKDRLDWEQRFALSLIESVLAMEPLCPELAEVTIN